MSPSPLNPQGPNAQELQISKLQAVVTWKQLEGKKNKSWIICDWEASNIVGNTGTQFPLYKRSNSVVQYSSCPTPVQSYSVSHRNYKSPGTLDCIIGPPGTGEVHDWMG